jgi:retron-type reverse transcriptase
MLAVQKWGKDKPYIIRIFAAQLVSTVQDMSEEFQILKLRRFANQKFTLPHLDGVTWREYEQNLEANLIDLHARVQRGAYRALPSRRKYIAKPDGRQRPLGIAALEDKIVQRAVVEVLNAIYETDFLGFSYGFRPKRSQHDALDALAFAINRTKVNWIYDENSG